ncbi:hypothetical protein JYU34_006809 [Plutella xylostella]|uniref:Uncharacterized protein n=1 Tax=Plutella xylostella TaxID=51655 RepID=A0ABQ7QSW0_PLUXY|nr:hypothetical protein JYU34_006809 [Plutella xylostella]
MNIKYDFSTAPALGPRRLVACTSSQAPHSPSPLRLFGRLRRPASAAPATFVCLLLTTRSRRAPSRFRLSIYTLGRCLEGLGGKDFYIDFYFHCGGLPPPDPPEQGRAPAPPDVEITKNSRENIHVTTKETE